MTKKHPDSEEHDLACQPRRIPRQARSRQRFERILEVSRELIAARGSEGMTMSDIVDGAEVSFGSLYQYFPDKVTIIATLAGRYNEEGRLCVAAALDGVTERNALSDALKSIVDEYYQLFRSEPAMRAIWQAMQADKGLQKLDAQDLEAHGAMLAEVLARLSPHRDRASLDRLARLVMQLIAAAVRHAISFDATREGDNVIAAFKAMLPNDLLDLPVGPDDNAGDFSNKDSS